MPQKEPLEDPADGLIVDEVGPWASEKHARLQKYIQAYKGARAVFLPPVGTGGASYIDLFCGPGRSKIRDTNIIIDGSPLVAYKAARATGARFSDLHFGDLNSDNVETLRTRVKALGGAANMYEGEAAATVSQVVAALDRTGLHFAFLDPYKLEQLPFSVIEKLSKLKRMDMLIHVSVHDLQRNLDAYTRVGGVLDGFMPGWRTKVDARQAIKPLRAALLEYWLSQIRALGTSPAQGIELVVGGKNQPLYWLVFVSAHSLGHKLWEAIRDVRGQGAMGF